MNQNNLSQVSINELSSKLQSKKELYQWLVQDCQAYLPPINSTNVYFFKAIMRGSKEYITRDKIMVSAVPQIEGLTVEDILGLFRADARLLQYLPDERDWVHIDRKWVCDILYTIDKAHFQTVITAAMKTRKDKLDQSRHLLVELRPEFAAALSSCLNFSSKRSLIEQTVAAQHGRAANLMKGGSKRKRTRSELEEVKTEEKDLKEDRQSFLQQVKRLKREKSLLESQLEEQEMMQINPRGGPGASGSSSSHPHFDI